MIAQLIKNFKFEPSQEEFDWEVRVDHNPEVDMTYPILTPECLDPRDPVPVFEKGPK